MPKSIIVYKVFLASPGDVKEERAEVKKVVELFNQMNSKNGIKLELVCWEDSTSPAFGKYPQEVVSSQIGDDYDIFIGILWARFGTPTPHFGSGTEEEFNGAYRRLQCGDKIEIMIYFKDDNISPSQIDPVQLGKVKEFISKLPDLGGYYFSFKSKEEFHDLLLKHLKESVDRLEQENNTPSVINSIVGLRQEEHPQECTAQTDNWGFFEYEDFILQKTQDVIASINQMTSLTERFNGDINMHTQEFLYLQKNPNRMYAKSICINTARDMNRYAKDIDVANKSWFTGLGKMQDAVRNMLEISEGLTSNSDWEGLVDSLHYLSGEMGKTYSAIRQLYTAVNSIPKISQPLNIARQNVCKTLKDILTNVETGRDYCEETISAIENQIHPIE